MKIVVIYERILDEKELEQHNKFVKAQNQLGNEVWEFGGGTKNPKPRP